MIIIIINININIITINKEPPKYEVCPEHL